MNQVFVVHHNPNNGQYQYAGDPHDAVASAQALLAQGESTWVAGNCRRMLSIGDLLLFKFGGARLCHEPGIYAAARVTRAPAKRDDGTWVLRYKPDPSLTRQLIRDPIVGARLGRLVPRSFGASIQLVPPQGQAALAGWFRRCGRVAPRLEGPDAQGITRGLLILKTPLDKILSGNKTWEIRGKATTRRGPIALIESKSGHIVGTCELVDVIGPLTLAALRRNTTRTRFRPDRLPYPKTYAWVLRNARRLAEAVPYTHPPGAVIWVRLDPSVLRQLG
jgi:hypothetical protein